MLKPMSSLLMVVMFPLAAFAAPLAQDETRGNAVPDLNGYQAGAVQGDPMPRDVATPPPPAPVAPDLVLSKSFRKSYRHHKKPRFAVLLNRQLSDDVDLWHSQVVSVGVSNEFKNAHARSKPKAATDWEWRYEDAFMQPFLQQGVRLINRATIVRLVSAKADKPKWDKGDMPDMPAGVTDENYSTYMKVLNAAQNAQLQQAAMNTLLHYMKVETDALVGYADYYIELLVTKSPSSPGGVLFKGNVIEVKTGMIIASVNSSQWASLYAGAPSPNKVHYEATSSGYRQVVESQAASAPSPTLVAHHLAIDVMNAIEAYWKTS